MLKEEKIHLMTRLTLYEKGEGKHTIPIGKYHKKDYVALKMLQTAFLTAIAYFCILALWILGSLEALLEGMKELNFLAAGVGMLLGLVMIELLFLSIAHRKYSRQYADARKSLKPYYQDLKHMHHYY
jgi:hypothetical protein